MHINNIQSVLLITSTEKKAAASIGKDIERYCNKRSILCEKLWLNGLKGKTPARAYDLAISIGGDGTVLFASRVLSPHSTPILPINVGNFGFITEIGRDDWKRRSTYI